MYAMLYEPLSRVENFKESGHQGLGQDAGQSLQSIKRPDSAGSGSGGSGEEGNQKHGMVADLSSDDREV